MHHDEALDITKYVIKSGLYNRVEKQRQTPSRTERKPARVAKKFTTQPAK